MTIRAAEHAWAIPEPGETIAGKYRIEGECGRGGLAVVLSAVQVGLGRRVAVKMLLPEWAGHPEARERFLREGWGPARMQSAHVVRVFDVDTLETGAPYLVLEYLEGHNLEQLVATYGPVHVPTAIDWILQVSEAIGEAHALGIIHRDIKPSNLVLTRGTDGQSCVKVIDFGLWQQDESGVRGPRLTRTTEVMGSPHYMSPEQLRAGCITDNRTDIWALGAVLHELLAGQPPFRGQSIPELFAAILTQAPPPLSWFRGDVPLEVEAVIARCLQQDPDARFQSVAEFADALAPYALPGAGLSREPIGQSLPHDVQMESFTSLVPPPHQERSMSQSSSREADTDPMGPAFATPASAGVVLPSLFILAAAGALAFAGLYYHVHRHDAERTEASRRAVAAAIAARSTAAAEPKAVLTDIPPPAPESKATVPPKPLPPPALVTPPASPLPSAGARSEKPEPRRAKPAKPSAASAIRSGRTDIAAAPESPPAKRQPPAGAALAPWLAPPPPAEEPASPLAPNPYGNEP